MSGHSYERDCFKCGGKSTLKCYVGTEPIDTGDGWCTKCGFEYWTELGQLSKEMLHDRIADYENNGD